MANSVWTIMKILNWTKQYFEAKGVENPRLDAEVLLCAVLKCQRITLYVDFERLREAAALVGLQAEMLEAGPSHEYLVRLCR